MRFLWLSLLAIVSALAFASHGYARDLYGVGRVLNNDSFATITDDRWRTGSGTLSVVWSDHDGAGLPARVGDMVEFRFRGEVITPSNLVTPAAGDRPYAASLSFGLHTHFQLSGFDVSAGADLVLTGPQTGLDQLQSAIHSIIDVPEPSAATLNAQIPNGTHGHATLEVSKAFAISDRLTLRPFVELQGGTETLARLGGDLHFGALARDEVLVRDAVTGHRYRIRRDKEPGWAAVFGADFAYVSDSIYLPASSGVTLSDTRSRVRAGVHWQNDSLGVFYGLTWLSKEFEAQKSAQTIGTLHIDIVF